MLVTKYVLCVIIRGFENTGFSLHDAAETGISAALLWAWSLLEVCSHRHNLKSQCFTKTKMALLTHFKQVLTSSCIGLRVEMFQTFQHTNRQQMLLLKDFLYRN